MFIVIRGGVLVGLVEGVYEVKSWVYFYIGGNCNGVVFKLRIRLNLDFVFIFILVSFVGVKLGSFIDFRFCRRVFEI